MPSARVAWIVALVCGAVGFVAVLVLLLGVVLPMRTELEDLRARLAEATQRELEARAGLAQATDAQRRLAAQSAAMSDQIEARSTEADELKRQNDAMEAERARQEREAEEEAKKAKKGKKRKKR